MSWAIVSSVGTPIAVDTVPPVISAISSGTPGVTTDTITWTTDEASDSQVEYGLTTGYGSSSSLNTSLVTSHSVGLTGLASSTLYHYRVKSRDAAGNLAASADQTFTTAVPSFTPTDIAGLKLWLKADVGTFQDTGTATPATANNDPVGGWRDQSGLGNHAIQATAGLRPLLKTNIQNSKPVLRFDGVDDTLDAGTATMVPVSVANFTIFIVTSAAVSGVNQAVLARDDDTVGRGYVVGWGANGANLTSYAESNGGGWVTDTVNSLTLNQKYLLTYFDDDTGNVARRSHNTITDTSEVKKINGANATGNTYLGSRKYTTSRLFFTGDICEVLVYDSPLSGANLTAVHAYLNTRWALY